MKPNMLRRRRVERLFYCLIPLVLVLGALPLHAGSTTTVQDVVYRGDGHPATGTLVISWGNSLLSQRANNYFGIKARRGQPAIELPTVEYVNGAPVRGVARFAKYESMKACFADRDRMIASMKAYEEARNAADPETFVMEVGRHWASDPDYAEKVLYIYRVHGLAELDKQAA